MAFFLCALERKKREREESFLERIYALKRVIENEMKCKLRLIFHFGEDKRVEWVEMINCRQEHPIIKNKRTKDR